MSDLGTADPISAVFLIAFCDTGILAVQNERGWDIPGGHVEPGETAIAALHREVQEEAGARFSHAVPFATLQIPPRRDLMLFFVTSNFELGSFRVSADVLARAVMRVDALLERYHGDAQILARIIQAALSVLA